MQAVASARKIDLTIQSSSKNTVGCHDSARIVHPEMNDSRKRVPVGVAAGGRQSHASR